MKLKFYLILLFTIISLSSISQINHGWMGRYLRNGTSLDFWAQQKITGDIKKYKESEFKINEDTTAL